MKRPTFAVLRGLLLALALAVLASQAPGAVLAAPHAQDPKPVIAQPETDAAVRGVVQIIGTATHPQFQRFELYYAPYPVPGDNAWIFIGPDAHFQQQPLGLLGTWDSRAVPDGNYALRVRVVKLDGNYIDSEARQLRVANTRPTDTPTPSASPTPEGTSTPSAPVATAPPPTAPAVATVPPAARPTSSSAATAVAGGAAAGPTAILGNSNESEDTSSLIDDAGKAFNLGRLTGSIKEAATYTVALFVAIGFFFGVKALLYYFWQRMRP